MQTLTATHCFEIEVRLSATYSPGCPAWGGSRLEPALNPPEDPSVEDLDIEDIGLVTYDSAKSGPARFGFASLLNGVDRKSEAYRQIVANILEMIDTDAADALLSEAA